MSKFRILVGIVLFPALIGLLSSYTIPNGQGKLNITIAHYAGTTLLNLDDSEYKNELGQTFTVSRFRYYMSNITLKTEDGRELISPTSFLVDEAEPDSKKIELTDIPALKYVSISFIIGVDSLHNVSGAQGDNLDPAKGMFWTWSTGYIFLKLEGHARASTSPGHIFEYHIGGYAAPNNCIRKVTLKLANGGLNVSNRGANNIRLKADILEILKTPFTVDFSKLSSVTDLHNATTIADNYADMFTVAK